MGAVTKPHMVIGIDLGMTCTGVSYTNLSIGSETVRWVRRWPGRFQANENKVPTVVVYPIGSDEPSSWGFLSETTAETTSEDKEYKEWFKTCLDADKLRQKQFEDPKGAPTNLQDVEQWYRDYLRKMIEFIISVPTTWAPIPTVENFKRLVCEAGFGSQIQHSVNIGLTEAEAVAVHVSIEAPGIFHENDILLVCDAGGGTTDLSVLRVTGTVNQVINLQQLDVVFGETIGSAAIDYEFEQLVTQRLIAAHERAPATNDTPIFSIAIPQVPYSYNNCSPKARVRNGELMFDRHDLQRLFDKQIAKLFKLIDAQLETLQQKFSNERVAHLVLSGGLGNSAYVQAQLRKHYRDTAIPNAKSLSIRIAPDPQLAVCKGLVADRVRKLLTLHSVLGWRCCRASYGTACKIAYDKRNPDHLGKKLVKDTLKGRMYVTQAIAWFVKKGEPVSVDSPIVHRFLKNVSAGDPRRAFPTSVITSVIPSDLEASQLTEQMNDRKYTMKNLQTADENKFVAKNSHFWSLKKQYLRIEYEIRFIIGPADIRFELWFDDQKLSRDEAISVEWTPAAPPSSENFEPATYGRVELPDTLLTSMSGDLEKGSIDSHLNGKIERTGTNILRKDRVNSSEEKKKRNISGLLGRTRGEKWSIST
ncbi:uncharacterized protein M421DRAFT_5288 [Didymella exigua CBS 183.55]|uniref:Actin-like ATPase domain-containing protein n=1 Tax=Didymella exigua CBS 183.55 TaxID=1150837 RepID=A0A6A5RLT5_9PLEO|nr:uncharacterized protein M421DRAFT_5288 [Didymella exigua CBS 183.55]KAF1928220.1 hypothetical protein M421DRAFT_5288 [Didymella exigua CBS 183.55]